MVMIAWIKLIIYFNVNITSIARRIKVFKTVSVSFSTVPVYHFTIKKCIKTRYKNVLDQITIHYWLDYFLPGSFLNFFTPKLCSSFPADKKIKMVLLGQNLLLIPMKVSVMKKELSQLVETTEPPLALTLVGKEPFDKNAVNCF